MKLVEQTPTRLVFQGELGDGCIPKGANVDIDAFPYVLGMIGGYCWLLVVGSLLDKKVVSGDILSTIAPYLIVGGLCTFGAWWGLTTRTKSRTQLFDLESKKLTLSATYPHHRKTQSEYNLDDFYCINIRHSGACSSLTIRSKDGWGIQIYSSASTPSVESELLTISTTLSEFLSIPIYKDNSEAGIKTEQAIP